MLLIDGHLDLAMNAINWDRDLDLEVLDIRRREAEMTEKGRGCGTTTLPELHKAEVAVCVATVIDRTARPNSPATGSACQAISYAKARGQLAYYRLLERQGKVRMIRDWPSLAAHWDAWASGGEADPLGLILAMEGADPIVTPDQVYDWWEDGLRVVGPSHYGVSAYAHGTGTDGGLTDLGAPLLRAMDDVGMILDLTHLAEKAFWEALDIFDGPVLASHNNCRALVPGDRQFSDEQVRAIVQRDGVIGVALDAWMLKPGWVIGETTPEGLTLEAVADHVDRICQLAGDTAHAAIGSDLDGGYGTEQTPSDLDTIADLQRVLQILRGRGYGQSDLEAIAHGNWLRRFQQAWS
jgi:membrane dipeptidase